jgi:hypothetical protein
MITDTWTVLMVFTVTNDESLCAQNIMHCTRLLSPHSLADGNMWLSLQRSEVLTKLRYISIRLGSVMSQKTADFQVTTKRISNNTWYKLRLPVHSIFPSLVLIHRWLFPIQIWALSLVPCTWLTLIPNTEKETQTQKKLKHQLQHEIFRSFNTFMVRM